MAFNEKARLELIARLHRGIDIIADELSDMRAMVANLEATSVDVGVGEYNSITKSIKQSVTIVLRPASETNDKAIGVFSREGGLRFIPTTTTTDAVVNLVISDMLKGGEYIYDCADEHNSMYNVFLVSKVKTLDDTPLSNTVVAPPPLPMFSIEGGAEYVEVGTISDTNTNNFFLKTAFRKTITSEQTELLKTFAFKCVSTGLKKDVMTRLYMLKTASDKA